MSVRNAVAVYQSFSRSHITSGQITPCALMGISAARIAIAMKEHLKVTVCVIHPNELDSLRCGNALSIVQIPGFAS